MIMLEGHYLKTHDLLKYQGVNLKPEEIDEEIDDEEDEDSSNSDSDEMH